ncbi:aldo/keto reductase [Methylobacterium flocculans]|uniref:aldo/keto reductase n=1 Tax=Methylobacterium flocculans TaxID=2984843 RepID=UPI0021F3A31D|nr:aldo/keto reductase [Methylobacterium sp. FF17]
MTEFSPTPAQLGLGCNRLGSLLGASSREAEMLIRGAVDLGVRLFDTADVYGQGESEQILGNKLGRHRSEVLIVTKGGQFFPQPWRTINPFKKALAPIVRSLSFTRNGLRNARSGMLPQDFSPAYLTKAAERSLRRLRTDSLDAYLLHSPSSDILREREAIGTLAELKVAGKVRKIGVSCEELTTAFDALYDERIEIIQFPVGLEPETVAFLEQATEKGKILIARRNNSIITPNSNVSQASRGGEITALTRSLLAKPEISWVLLGTTKLSHLQEVVDGIKYPPKMESFKR